MSERAAIPSRPGYGTGIYRRRIRLIADAERAYGELADDFHHFAATLGHDGEQITEIGGEAIRTPWTTCPGSVDALEKLRGTKLAQAQSGLAGATDPRIHCTHLLDVALLTAAHAYRHGRAADRSWRRYEVEVPDRREGRTRALLLCDGNLLLDWVIDGATIEDALHDALVGRKIVGGGFTEFVEDRLEPDIAEAALVLRRAVMIAMGRTYDFDRIARASEFSEMVGDACHTFDPDRAPSAGRIIGSARDFTARPDDVLSRDR